MNRIIFTFLFLFPFVGHSFAQQQKYETLQVMNEERQEYQNEVQHFITHTYYDMLVEAIATTEVHNSFINYLMQEDVVKYMPEFVSNYADKRYMSPAQYFGCLHRAFSAYNSDELKFSINNMQVDNDFYSYGLRGCFIRAEYDLEIKYQNEILSRKRCRMYCLFPNRSSKNIIKVMQLEPVKDLYFKNVAAKQEELTTENESFETILKNAKRGDCNAQFELGEMYYYGKGVSKNYSEAVKWYRKAADQGDEIAQCNLGICYKNGQGVPQNYQEAVKWYRKAAEQGDKVAQFNLGICYKNGQGVPQNYQEAVKWYRKAAEQGNSDAQNNLGVCYEYGRGVPKDYYEAVKWFRKSADQGVASAQYNLGLCFYLGCGVPKDYREARKWLKLAAAQDDEKAKSLLADLNSQLLKNNESKNITESNDTRIWVKEYFATPLTFHEGTTVLEKPTEANAQLREYCDIALAKQLSLSIVGHISQAESAAGDSLAWQRAKKIESMLKKHGFIQDCEVGIGVEPQSDRNNEVEILYSFPKTQ